MEATQKQIAVHSVLIGAKAQQFGLVNDLHAELLRFIQLRASLGASDDVVGLLADAAADLTACRLDLSRSLFARQFGQRASQDESPAGQRTGLGFRLVELGAEIQAGCAQAFDQLPVPRIAVPLDHALGNDLARESAIVARQAGSSALVGGRYVDYPAGMSTVAEIKQAVSKLPQRKKLALVQWLHTQVDDRLNDEEMMTLAAEGARALDKREAA